MTAILFSAGGDRYDRHMPTMKLTSDGPGHIRIEQDKLPPDTLDSDVTFDVESAMPAAHRATFYSNSTHLNLQVPEHLDEFQITRTVRCADPDVETSRNTEVISTHSTAKPAEPAVKNTAEKKAVKK